jgi:bla regulator protein blaR1
MRPGSNLLLPSAACVVIVAVAAQSPDARDWQTAAGGKMAFEVASVKPSLKPRVPNFDLSAGNAVAPGGRLFAGFTLWIYVTFAYKLSLTEGQHLAAVAQLPKWFNTDFFEIDARAKGNASKDQMRLMMQSLLADRFKLAVHFETREVPALALTLVKPGKTGPKLRPHAEGPPCPDYTPRDPGSRPPLPQAGEIFPAECNTAPSWFKPDGSALLGSRNTTMILLADTVQSYGSMSGEVDRPVVDRTGLSGTFDYVIEWTGRLSGPSPTGPAAAAPPDPLGTTFLQALREQLGLKLVPTRAPIRTIVIDHVEKPSEN